MKWLSKRNLASVCIIVLQLAVLLAVSLYLDVRQRHHISNSLTAVNTLYTTAVQKQLHDVVFLNARNAAVFSITGIYVSLTDFVSLLQLPLSSTAGLVEIWRFIPIITPGNISRFNEFCQSMITEQCFLKEITPGTGTTVTLNNSFSPVSTDRPLYYPNMYLFPESSNYPVFNTFIGLDLNSFPFGALELKQFQQRSNSTSVSTRVNIVLNTASKNSYGISIATPTYDVTNNLIGYTSVVIRLETLISAALQSSQMARDSVNVAMYEITNDTYVQDRHANISLLFKDDTANFHNAWFATDVQTYDRSTQFTFLDRDYIVYSEFSKKYKQSLHSVQAIAIPCSIAAVLLLLNVIFMLIHRVKASRAQVLDGERASKMLKYLNHEVRNPLNIIRGVNDSVLETLVEEPDDLKGCIEDLTIVSRTCSFLEHIVSDILVIQKLEDDALPIVNKTCRLNSIIHDVVQSVAQKADENKDVRILTDCAEAITLNIDPFRLKQILLNLVCNAMTYTKKGTITVKAATLLNHNVMVEVIDTGVGIAEDNKHLIFCAHMRHDDVANMARHGNQGLGLHLVKILALRMGWQVGFKSVLNVGSSFWVEIPEDQFARRSLSWFSDIELGNESRSKSSAL